MLLCNRRECMGTNISYCVQKASINITVSIKASRKTKNVRRKKDYSFKEMPPNFPRCNRSHHQSRYNVHDYHSIATQIPHHSLKPLRLADGFQLAGSWSCEEPAMSRGRKLQSLREAPERRKKKVIESWAVNYCVANKRKCFIHPLNVVDRWRAI